MIRRLSLRPLAALLLLLASCKAAQQGPSISPSLMGRILTDIHLAEVYSTMVTQDSLQTMTEKNTDSLARYYREIFAHYEVTPEEVRESLEWYKRNPEQMDTVYARMLPRLSELEALYPPKQ